MTLITNSPPQVIDISLEEFNQLPESPQLIDVRSKFEYGMFHAPDAVNLSLPRILIGCNSRLLSWFLPQWFQELSKNEPVALICLTAHRSPVAAEQLIKAGFTKVYNLTGGMMEWQKSGLPTSRITKDE